MLQGYELVIAVVAAFGAGVVIALVVGRARIRVAAAQAQTIRDELDRVKPFEEEVHVLRTRAERIPGLEENLASAQKSVSELNADLSRLNANEKAGDDARAELRRTAARLEKELTDHRTLVGDLREQNSELKTSLEKEREAHAEKLTELNEVKSQIEKDLKILADSLLKENSEQFLKRAKEIFDAQGKQAREGVEAVVKPVDEALKAYQKHLAEMEKERKQEEGQLAQQMRHITETHAKLHDTTSNLVNALKAAPKTRGRWGEQQLRTVLEMAGMMEFVDFTTEHHMDTDDGRRRPDVVIRMPGGRNLVVDAKTSMAAYLEAVEETDDDAREAKLKDHARQLRNHAMQLGSKDYWKHLSEAPDFVVMFVPGDNLYAAAIERDPNLFEEAYNRQVIIATPTTFLALAKAVAFGWRQEKASQEARKIHDLGTELYKRMVRLGGKVAAVTKALDTTVNKHNDFIASLEGAVLPQARKFQDLSIGHGYGDLDELEPVERDVREPRADRDLVFDDDPSPSKALPGATK